MEWRLQPVCLCIYFGAGGKEWRDTAVGGGAHGEVQGRHAAG